MRKILRIFGLFAALAPLGAAASPLSDRAALYRGAWREVARYPMFITNGCDYGTTRYSGDPLRGGVLVRDACRRGGPNGPETVLTGEGEFAADGALTVRYNFLLKANYKIV
ncbi:MAG: lipocalin family protein, partial [Hyphomicrobiales bacterium]|nr:lipocalin family protein [Hyphomicrobiales bacterium]